MKTVHPFTISTPHHENTLNPYGVRILGGGYSCYKQLTPTELEIMIQTVNSSTELETMIQTVSSYGVGNNDTNS